MPILNYNEAFQKVKEGVIDAVKQTLPFENDRRKLEVLDVSVDDNLDPQDFESQKSTKLSGRSWGVPVKAKVRLIDKETNKVVDEGEVMLARLPKLTPRFSYIVDGTEYTPRNLFRLKSGVYHRVKQNGELESQFNLAKGQGFHMDFNPENRKFNLRYGKSNVALYPILKALDISDDEIQQRFGSKILDPNKSVNNDAELRKFYKASTGKEASSIEEAKGHVKKVFEETEVYPDVTATTIGKPYSKVTGGLLLDSANKLLKISRGEDTPDKRELQEFKEVHATEDMLRKRILDSKSHITRKLNQNSGKESLRQVITPDLYRTPVRTLFTRTGISARPDQTNPLDMVSNYLTTTILGEGVGGIASEQAVTEEEKLINPSTLGFIDPIQTPESGTAGIQLNLALGVSKKGNTLTTQVYDVKKKQRVEVDPKTLHYSNVAFPDQYARKGKELHPIKPIVKVSGSDGEVRRIPAKDVDYVIPSTAQLFSFGANLVPFLQSNNGNRAMTASRQQAQAVSLIGREAPLVQVEAPDGDTFEHVLGYAATQTAPVDGKVKAIKKDHILIQSKGKTHKVGLYKSYPLNDNKSFLESTPTVKVGDVVKKGQQIADTNYVKDGVLALGKNLKVAYMPYKGLNFEDGIVVSESASKKLTSQHLHKESTPIGSNMSVSLKKFLAHYPYKLTSENRHKLGSDGIIQEGAEVLPGETMVAATKVKAPSTETEMLQRLHKTLGKESDASVVWEKDHKGIVDKVVKKPVSIEIYVKTQEPLEVGDKLVGRHGNKGVTTRIIPDHEMPKTKDGEPVDVILNPAGVVGRVNLGQLLETAASKIAKKTGQVYKVKNFDSNIDDYTDKILSDLKKHGLSDTEELVDPLTNKSLGSVLTGDQYILKLKHQVTKDKAARSRAAYDVNLIPKGGGDASAQSMDFLGINAMLASGATANLREMMTLKSDKNDDVWTAIQTGAPIPAPQTTFAYKKFDSLLKGLGVNVTKEGNLISITPVSDKAILGMSNGEIKDPGKEIIGKNFNPEKKGLFDPAVTGGLGGTKWSHIKLPEPLPKPIFEKAIKAVTGLKTSEFNNIVSGRAPVDGKYGGEALKSMLDKIDVNQELKRLEETIPKLSKAALSDANKKYKYLKTLKELNLKPSEAYMSQIVPVLPPIMRPISETVRGDIRDDDLNSFYRRIGMINHQLKTFDPGLPEEEKIPLREKLYQTFAEFQGITKVSDDSREPKGILNTLHGHPQPKKGFIHSKLLSKKQDFSMRATITPEPSMNMDEVGIPKKYAMETYKPFVVREIVQRLNYTPLQARELIKQDHPVADKMLEKVVENRPILMKRDPTLHKYGIQAFKPIIIGGGSIKIHPLVVSGFNADFDGDHMSGYVPLTEEAVLEAKKMFPSNNLFAPSSGNIMFAPQHEAQIGLYKLTKWGKDSGKSFKSLAEAARTAKDEKSDLSEVVSINGKKTTLGRAIVAHTIPSSVNLHKDILYNKNYVLDKKNTQAMLSEIALKAKNDYSSTVSELLRIGNRFSYEGNTSVSLEDMRAQKIVRDAIINKADGMADKVIRTVKNPEKRDEELVKIYGKASDSLNTIMKSKYDSSENKMYDWVRSGSRGNWDQFRQMTIAPMLVVDSTGKVVPTPITRSYSEGLDVASYITGLHGARKGTIQKVQETQEPGAFTKRLVNTNMSQVVVSDDCGTDKGIVLSITNADILGRFLAIPTKVKNRTLPAGTEVTSDIVTQLKNNGVNKAVVRSPLKCLEKDGVCQKCFGKHSDGSLPDFGDNLGVMASQAIGEKLSQGALSAFHTGGVVKGEDIIDQFTAVSDLLKAPKTLAGSATLAKKKGSVDRIIKDPAGGYEVFVEGVRHYVPSNRELQVKKGDSVAPGDKLSSGRINIHELLPLTNLPTAQNYVSTELENIFGKGIRRRNIETVVRGFSNTAQVVNPGSHPSFIRGDVVPVTHVEAYNHEIKKRKGTPIVYEPLVGSIETIPTKIREDWLARLSHTGLKDTLIEAAARGWKSDIHGAHPVPGLIYGTEFGKPPKGKKGHY